VSSQIASQADRFFKPLPLIWPFGLASTDCNGKTGTRVARANPCFAVSRLGGGAIIALAQSLFRAARQQGLLSRSKRTGRY
jgi:hypothetical protein